jgi:hypothetical protein
VVVGVARGVQDPQPERPGVQHVSVSNRVVLEAGIAAGGQDVGCAGARGELEPAGDVVVVHVGLEDVGEAQAALLDEVEDPVDVTLRVDDDGDLPVGGQVAAVAQAGGLDGLDLDHGVSPAQ